MIAPHRIAEVQIARIGSRTDDSAADSANGRARRRAARGRTHKGARTGTNKCARRRAIARVRAAAGQSQHRNRRTCDDEISHPHLCLLKSLRLCG
jgi:hypothetical protein